MPLLPRPTYAGALAVALLAALPTGVALRYDDVADRAGIRFQLAGEVHDPEEHPNDRWPSLPEVPGGGACLADLDGDGYDDLYLVTPQYNPDNPHAAAWLDAFDPTNKLYLNDGDGTFRDATSLAGLESRRFGYGCSAADYDGDGDVDLFVANYGDGRFGGNELYRNEGDGTFTDVGRAAGVEKAAACGDHPCMSTSSAWADYDRDGDLDLYVGNYAETNLTDVNRGPNGHIAQKNWLFKNRGDGTFDEVAEPAGVAGNAADQEGSKTLGVVWFDADLDGDLDLYVANDGVPNDYYVNRGDGTFEERSDAAGLADPDSSMGLTSGDYDNDGLPDLFFTHFALQEHGFYRNLGNHVYENRKGEDDLANVEELVGWGTAFVDVDRDMDLDLMAVFGHTDWVVADYGQPTKVWRNDPEPEPAGPGDRKWVDVSNASGPGIAIERVSRGAAFGDWDLDGDTDLVVVNNANGTAQVLEASEVDHHWLVVQLRQPGPNRFAVGARVLLEAGGVAQYREVQTGTGYLSQNTLNLEFGLGALAQADRLRVQWPGGGTTELADLAADRVVRVDRATGTLTTDTLSPLTQAAFVGEAGRDGWFRSPVNATVVARDRAVGPASGIAATEFSADGGAWSAYTGQTLPFAAEGRHELLLRSTDAAGNREPIRRPFLGLDFAPPTDLRHTLTGVLGENGWWVEDPVSIALDASDALSGVDEFRYRVDEGAWATFEGPIAIDEDGRHRVDYFAVDRAGNAAPTASFTVWLDRTPPEAELVRPVAGGVYAGAQALAEAGAGPALIVAGARLGEVGGAAFPVEVDAADPTSGLARVVFLLDGNPVGRDAAEPYEWSWDTTASPSGAHRLSVVAVDQAGNISLDGVDVVLVSAAPPNNIL